MVAPSEISAAYSEMELQARLAVIPDASCQAKECEAIDTFRVRVERLGLQVSEAAYLLVEELSLDTQSFEVVVPGKDEIGTLSNASGSVIVFDGLRELELSDPALAFLIAREMGHVLARHHDENSATSIGISIAVAILFPVTNVLRGVEAAYATATTASLASTAVSMAGSRIVRGLYRSEQQREADLLALQILVRAGWSARDIAAGLEAALPRLQGVGWMNELLETKAWLDPIAMGPPLPPLPSLLLAALDTPADDGGAVRDDAPSLVEQLAADLFVDQQRGGAAELAWLAGPLHGEWGVEKACRAVLLTGVVLPGSLPARIKVAAPSSTAVQAKKAILAPAACAKRGVRAKSAGGSCIKPAAKKKPPKKRVLHGRQKRR